MSRRGIINELHAPARKHFLRRRVITKGINWLWQADLVEMGKYSSSNNGYRYLLTVIDTFSKYAWGEALKTKSAKDVAEAMEKIFKSGRGVPKNLQTDDGKEFFNSQFKSLMNRHQINHYSTFSTLKASIVERFNRTLKELMWKEFSYNGTYKWVDMYQELVNFYNKKIHRTIKMAPIEVNTENEKHILGTVYNNIKMFAGSKLKIGDNVRISKYKGVFEKSYTPNWNVEIFRIYKVQNTYPTTYLLEDLNGNPVKGGFYREELKKTKFPDTYLVERVLKREGKRSLVRWLGFPKSDDSWINNSEIL